MVPSSIPLAGGLRGAIHGIRHPNAGRSRSSYPLANSPSDSVRPPAHGGKLLLLVLPVVAGILIGIGGYTFKYAEGFSYLSNDPKACVNCHIMRPQYDSWQKSSHHGVAVCVDCHLPVSLLGKLMTKASNGYHHSKGFTLQDFAEPIRIKPGNAAVLQENCLRCHADMVHQLVAGATTDRDAVSCVHCHYGVGHGQTAGVGPSHAKDRAP